MGADELHPGDTGAELHFDDQTVLVAAEVEDQAVFCADAGAGVLVLHRLRRRPGGLDRFFAPALRWTESKTTILLEPTRLKLS
jgi:hypothetical protein